MPTCSLPGSASRPLPKLSLVRSPLPVAFTPAAPALIQGESAWGGQEFNYLEFIRTVRGGKGVDLRRGGIRSEPDFLDGDGRRITGREPQGFSVSPNKV